MGIKIDMDKLNANTKPFKVFVPEHLDNDCSASTSTSDIFDNRLEYDDMVKMVEKQKRLCEEQIIINSMVDQAVKLPIYATATDTNVDVANVFSDIIKSSHDNFKLELSDSDVLLVSYNGNNARLYNELIDEYQFNKNVFVTALPLSTNDNQDYIYVYNITKIEELISQSLDVDNNGFL